jgi:hypothetical protein
MIATPHFVHIHLHKSGGTFINECLLRFFPEQVASLGGDPAALLCDAGIEGADATTYRQAVALLDLGARALDCRDFGLRLAARQEIAA